MASRCILLNLTFPGLLNIFSSIATTWKLLATEDYENSDHTSDSSQWSLRIDLRILV